MDSTTSNDQLSADNSGGGLVQHSSDEPIGDSGHEMASNNTVSDPDEASLIGVMDAQASSELAQEMASVAGALFGLLLPGLSSTGIQPVEPTVRAGDLVPAPVAFPTATSVPLPSRRIALPAEPTLVAAPLALPLPQAIPVEPFVADRSVAEEAAAAQRRSLTMALLNEVAFLDD